MPSRTRPRQSSPAPPTDGTDGYAVARSAMTASSTIRRPAPPEPPRAGPAPSRRCERSRSRMRSACRSRTASRRTAGASTRTVGGNQPRAPRKRRGACTESRDWLSARRRVRGRCPGKSHGRAVPLFPQCRPRHSLPARKLNLGILGTSLRPLDTFRVRRPHPCFESGHPRKRGLSDP